MKAVRLEAFGGPEALQFVTNAAKPVLNHGQILVHNQFAGVNYIDTYHRTGLYKVNLPYIPGREGAGIVVEVGSTSGFKVGDRVAFAHPNSYAEFCNVDCQSAFLLPDNISLEVGAALLLQGNTALALVKLAHAVKSGQVILVHAAAGGMGLLLVQLCKHLGATVIGTASTPEKAQLAKDAGADHVILYSHENVVEKVMLITNQRGVDAVFDGVGKSTFDDSLKCLANFGSMVSFGNASGKVDPVDIMKLVPKSIKLSRPSLFAMLNDPKDFADYSKTVIQLTLDSVLKFNIFKTYDLKDAQQAHADLESRKTNGKLLLRI